MKVRVEYLLFGLVGAVLLGLAFWSLAPERVPEPEAAAPEAVQAPAAPVAAAREAEPVATREVVPAAAAVQPDEPGATEPAIEKKDDPNAPFVPQHKTLEDRLTRAAEQQELETRWAKESVDQDWEKRTADRMTTLLAQNGVDSSAFGAVACRETICRFSLKSKTGKKTEVQSLIHVARSLDDQTWLDPEEQEDGSFGMQVYYPREGYRLSGGGGKIGEPKEVVEAANL